MTPFQAVVERPYLLRKISNMLTSAQALAKFGDPKLNEAKHMVMWDVPTALEIGVIPKKLYCNRAIVLPLEQAFKNLIATDFVDELKTWDGCFNIRPMKGKKTLPSLHSWGLAIDLNAAWNGYNKPTNLSAGFVKCFKDAGFDWGGDWSIKDGMHMQLAKL